MKKKILYIHHGNSYGGAPRSLSFLIKELDFDNYCPYVVFGIDEAGNSKLFKSVGAEVFYEKGIGPWHGSSVSGMNLKTLVWNHIFTLLLFIKLKKVLKKVQPDIVHINSTGMCFAAKIVKKYNSQIPVVCHVREPILQGFWGDILRKNCEKYVDQFIAIEQYDAETLHTQKPVEVINNFVDFSIYNEKVQSDCLYKELGIDVNDKILLYLARVVPVNGALPMIEALTSLLKRRKDIHLCIVGVSDSKDDYTEKIVHIVEQYDNMHLLSFRSDVPQVIASSDVMIVPFQEPHFARSVIEAGAMGVPSIGSNIGGLTELIEDKKTGYLFNYKTFANFADLCEQLIDDEILREKFGKNSIKLAHEKFDAKRNAQRTFEIYERMIK